MQQMPERRPPQRRERPRWLVAWLRLKQTPILADKKRAPPRQSGYACGFVRSFFFSSFKKER